MTFLEITSNDNIKYCINPEQIAWISWHNSPTSFDKSVKILLIGGGVIETGELDKSERVKLLNKLNDL